MLLGLWIALAWGQEPVSRWGVPCHDPRDVAVVQGHFVPDEAGLAALLPRGASLPAPVPRFNGEPAQPWQPLVDAGFRAFVGVDPGRVLLRGPVTSTAVCGTDRATVWLEQWGVASRSRGPAWYSLVPRSAPVPWILAVDADHKPATQVWARGAQEVVWRATWRVRSGWHLVWSEVPVPGGSRLVGRGVLLCEDTVILPASQVADLRGAARLVAAAEGDPVPRWATRGRRLARVPRVPQEACETPAN